MFPCGFEKTTDEEEEKIISVNHKSEDSVWFTRIRDLREDADLRQQDVAEYLRCSQVGYSRYETGKRDIPTDVLIALAKFYRTSVDHLLGLTDNPKPYPQSKRK